MSNFRNNLYYHIKPLIPRSAQIFLRRQVALRKLERYKDVWPIDERAATPPAGWPGWPEGKRFAFVLTHDVDTQRGHDRCYDLARLEMEMGFRSSFNFVPKRYNVSGDLRSYLTDNHFEVGVHGLYHDGKLYNSREIFRKRAHEINLFLNDWGSVGFRSPSMQHNLEWIHDLNILYDASTFDTDPFEPQSDGMGTIFPFFVPGPHSRGGYVELPYTLAQDFTLFVLMKARSIDVWRKKLDWVAQKEGAALINVHPDYIAFGGRGASAEEYPVSYYEDFLRYAKDSFEGQYLHLLPKDLAAFILSMQDQGQG